MLDELSGGLLAALNALVEGGGFKIVEQEDILRLVHADAEEVARRMSCLEERRLIDLKYAEAGEYCVRILAAGRGYGMQAAREKQAERKERRDIFLSSALGAFAGGALSGLLVLLISLLV